MMNYRKATPVPLDDEILVSRVQRGDDWAFQELYLRHARYLAGVAHRILGDDSDIDDIVQETFIAAAKGIHRIKEGKHIRFFLVTIAVRRAKRRIKRKIRKEKITERVKNEIDLDPDIEASEKIKQAYDLLAKVPKGLRIPWQLYKIEGYTLVEVSSICGNSPATIKRRIKKADDRIKRRLLHG